MKAIINIIKSVFSFISYVFSSNEVEEEVAIRMKNEKLAEANKVLQNAMKLQDEYAKIDQKANNGELGNNDFDSLRKATQSCDQRSRPSSAKTSYTNKRAAG